MNFSSIILQPHNTPLSQMKNQQKQILHRIFQFNFHHFTQDSWLEEDKRGLYPVYPSHCLVRSQLPITELKKKITRCSIQPPTIKNGFLYYPVEITGAEIQALPPELLYKILPVVREEELKNTEIPPGFVFGYLRNFDKININNIFEEFDIKPINLRVFRLHEIEYTWNLEEIPSPLYWTMELPHWIKLK